MNAGCWLCWLLAVVACVFDIHSAYPLYEDIYDIVPSCCIDYMIDYIIIGVYPGWMLFVIQQYCRYSN